MNGVSAFQEKKRQYGKHILREVALLMLPGEGNELRSFGFLFCFHDWKRLMTGVPHLLCRDHAVHAEEACYPFLMG